VSITHATPAAPGGISATEWDEVHLGGGLSWTKMDEPPASPDSINMEFDSASMTGWTFQASSGSPTNASLGEWQEGANPSNPTWNADTDIPSALVMQALSGANTMKCYRSFAPSSGTRWAVFTKVRLIRLAAGGANTLRARLFIENTTPTASQDFPVDGILVELGWDSDHFELRAFSVNNGSAGTVTSLAFGHSGTLYIALTCATSNAITAWSSLDGLSWVLLSTYSGLDINGAVSHVALTAGGIDASDEGIGIFEFIRFLQGVSSGNPWHLGAGN